MKANWSHLLSTRLMPSILLAALLLLALLLVALLLRLLQHWRCHWLAHGGCLRRGLPGARTAC